MLGAVVSFFFYLRVIVMMYMTPPVGEEEVDDHGADLVVRPHRRLPVPIGISAAVVVAIGFTIAIGVVPDPVADFARHATLLMA
jgi:NADH:ubiquinone oxidoreductase subunit 2 (subunit N)